MDNKKLISLEEHNKERLEQHFDLNKPKLNGLKCPKCGAPLYDPYPNVTLTSNPPQKNVECTKCNYAGYAYK